MKKEVFIAIFIGLTLGLIVTFGLYTARRSFSGGSSPLTTINSSPSPTPAASSSSILIASPEDESVQTTPDVRVAGTAQSNTPVIVFINSTPIILQSDASGNFSTQAKLETGSNVITVRILGEKGVIAEEERVVIYTTVPFEEAPTASVSASPVASPSPKVSPKPTPKLTPKASPKVSPAP